MQASRLLAIDSGGKTAILRLAYYIPPSVPVMLLSQKPANLAIALEKVLKDEPRRYSRIVWLDSADPLWSRLKTEAQKETEQRRVQRVLQTSDRLAKKQHLSGTMELDRFTVSLYREIEFKASPF